MFTRMSIALFMLVSCLARLFAVECFSVQAGAFSRGASRASTCTVTQWMTSDNRDEIDELLLDDSDDEPSQMDNLELAWRHAKKPLLRIGSKGATLTHGNSLRHLLNDHTIVKVKINTRKFGKIILLLVRQLCQLSFFSPRCIV